MVLFAVTLCDPYLSALEAFTLRRAIQIHVYFTLLYFTLKLYDTKRHVVLANRTRLWASWSGTPATKATSIWPTTLLLSGHRALPPLICKVSVYYCDLNDHDDNNNHRRRLHGGRWGRSPPQSKIRGSAAPTGFCPAMFIAPRQWMLAKSRVVGLLSYALWVTLMTTFENK